MESLILVGAVAFAVFAAAVAFGSIAALLAAKRKAAGQPVAVPASGDPASVAASALVGLIDHARHAGAAKLLNAVAERHADQFQQSASEAFAPKSAGPIA